LMKNTIMTEKIARRGVKTPHAYEPDILDKVTVQQVMRSSGVVLSEDTTIGEARSWLSKRKEQQRNYYIVATGEGGFKGIISSSNLFSMHHPVTQEIGKLIKRRPFAVKGNDTLKTAVEMMARENLDVLPVTTETDNQISGILSYRDILSSYRHRMEEHEAERSISLKRQTLKVLLHGRKKLATLKNR